MAKFKERRSRVRIDYDAVVVICPKGKPTITGYGTNVSMAGIFVKTQALLPVATECGIQISLQGPNSTLTINIAGIVARVGEEGVGLQFYDNLEWWAIFTIYAQYSGNPPTNCSLCCPGKVV